MNPYFQKMHGLPIVVVGDVMLDGYLFGAAAKISPEAPVPVHVVQRREFRLGGAANVAANLHGLGCEVTLFGLTGKDSARDELLTLLRAMGIDASGVMATESRCTTTKTRVVAGGQQMLRIDDEDIREISADEEAELCASLQKKIASGAAGIIISDYAKGVCSLSLCQQVIALAKDAGIPVVVDPKVSDWTRYQGADVLTPNLKELQDALATKVNNEEADIQAAVQQLRSKYSLQAIAVTRSEKGISWFGEEDRTWHGAAQAQEVYDVSGAGDTVAAVLAAAVALDLSPAVALELANEAAAVVVQRVGTYPISLSELAKSGMHADSLLTQEELSECLAKWRQAGDKIVFTNGCFDILHRGHVEYLAAASALGNRLVVGINSDDSVRRLKGEGRPIQHAADRAAVLSGLASVDAVVLFETDTPRELIRMVRPDVLVKGGDYRVEDIVGREFADETVTIPFREGYSTTHICEQIRKGSR